MIAKTDFAPRVIRIVGIRAPMNIRARLLKYSMPKMKASTAPPTAPLPGIGDATNIGRKMAPYFRILLE